MGIIADIITRYTESVGRTFLRLAARDAEASQRALARQHATRRRQVDDCASHAPRSESPIPEGGASLPGEATGTPAEGAGRVSTCAGREADRVPPDPGALLKARAVPAAPDLPMGVRGDVVVAYVDSFVGAGHETTAHLIDRLRKDRKVRVAELERIVAAVLDEAPRKRPKADHLAVLRRRLLPSVEGEQATVTPPRALQPAE